MMITKTQGFSIMNNPRIITYYAGVVPFDYQSGTSFDLNLKYLSLQIKS
jgi:hypothetical protein